MTPRALALTLVWAGFLLLALVVAVRARAGAWSAEAFDHPPPVPRWMVPVVALAGLLVAASVVLLVVSVVAP